MLVNKRQLLGMAALALAFTAAPALADSTVNVKLWDKGGMMDMSKNMGMGMGMKADMKQAIMGITLDKKAVPAGKVTLKAINTSKETVHEAIIVRVDNKDALLPYNDNENRVNEDAANAETGELGEVSELDPGKSGSLTVNLKPGLYVIYCNIPGHYMAGMWTTLQVK